MRRFGKLTALAALVAAPLGVVMDIGPAAALPVPPTLVTVTPSSQGTNPTLRWSAVATANRYELKACRDFGCTQGIIGVETVNTAYVTDNLPLGTIYWQVRSIDATGASDWGRSSFTRVQSSAPVISGPADGAQLGYPSSVPAFTWEPVAGAEDYVVETSQDANFTTKNQYTSRTGALSLTENLAVNTVYYWRVFARFPGGIDSQQSTPRTFRLVWDGVPTPTAPVDAATVEEIEMAWDPIPGAVAYDVDIASNDSFTNNVSVVGRNLLTNRVTIPFRMIDAQYFWRVRAVLPSTNKGDWSDSRLATKRQVRKEWPWPDAVASDNRRTELVKPANNTGVKYPFLQWTPTRKADHYIVEIEPDDSSEAFELPFRFDTTQTSLVPHEIGPGTYRWRVKPMDGDIDGEWTNTVSGLNGSTAGIIAGQAPAWKFSISYPGALNIRNLGTATSPLIAWDNVPGFNRYRVVVRKNSNNAFVSQEDTYNLAYAPQLDPQVANNGNYDIYVYTLDAFARPGGSAAMTFAYSVPSGTDAAPVLSTPTGGATVWYPALKWSPVQVPVGVNPDTIRYQLTIGSSTPVDNVTIQNVRNTAYVLRGQGGEYPVGRFGNFTASVYATGQYTSNSAPWTSGSSATVNFSVLPLGVTALTEPCTSTVACDLEATPTMGWTEVQGGAYYRLYIATNDNFNNPTFSTPSNVFYPVHTPRTQIADSQAGDSYYWYAQPCWADGACGAEPQNVKAFVRAFRKRAAPITILSPANGTVFNDQLTVRWEDFLVTNQKRGVQPSPSKADSALKDHSLEAARYRIQFSRTPDFNPTGDTYTADTEATSYTLWERTFDDGPVYFRVQAIDGSSNLLTWSAEANAANVNWVTKTTPVVQLQSPAPDAVIGASPVLTWAAQTHAQGYDLEIYKNADNTLIGLSDANKVAYIETTNPLWALRETLPEGIYGWRVRRRDGQARRGPWTANSVAELRRFTYAGGKPTLASPPNQSARAGTDLLFTWTPVPRAKRYRFQTSRTFDFSNVFEQAETQSTSWATLRDYGTETVFWRVTAIDSQDREMGTSDIWTLYRNGVGCEASAGQAGSGFYPVDPFRVYDSRSRPEGKLGANASRDITIAGVAGSNVPQNALAVVLNVTATGATAGSYLTIYPKGTAQPNASSLNFVANQTVPNQVTAMVGANQMSTFFNAAGQVHLIVDVVGYYGSSGAGAASKFNTTAQPVRMYDSRNAPLTKLAAGEERQVQVSGRDGVPIGATAVAMNVTVTGPTAESYMTIWPTGTARPNASSLNYTANLTVPNAVIAKVGANGRISLYNFAGQTNVLVDVVGWFETANGLLFHPLPPARILDTRSATPLAANETRASRGLAVGCVPAVGVDSIVVNATVTDNTVGGYLTLWPEGAAPNSSNLNWDANKTVPNAAIVRIGADGNYRVFSFAKTHVIVDVVGWFGA